MHVPRENDIYNSQEPTPRWLNRMPKLLPKTGWVSHDRESQFVQVGHLEMMSAIANDSVDCVWTDPPYFLSNDGTTCRAGQRVSVNKGSWDHSGGFQADHEFNRTWLAECHRILKPTGTIWVSGTHHVYFSVGMAMMELGLRLLNDIVWEKPNPPPNLGCRCFTHSTETLLWASKAQKGSSARYTFNYSDMKKLNGDRQMKNVWRLKAPGAAEKIHGKHPTQKPLALVERCILASTVPGDLVFAPFTGSGTTGVAALACGRLFLGSEIEPAHARVAEKRLAAADNDEVLLR